MQANRVMKGIAALMIVKTVQSGAYYLPDVK